MLPVVGRLLGPLGGRLVRLITADNLRCNECY